MLMLCSCTSNVAHFYLEASRGMCDAANYQSTPPRHIITPAKYNEQHGASVWMHHVHHALSSATIVVLMHAPITLAILRVSRHRLCLLYDELEQRRHNHAHAFLVRCVVFSYYSHKIDGKYDAAAFKYYGISVKRLTRTPPQSKGGLQTRLLTQKG
jgi:hypothetical protein